VKVLKMKSNRSKFKKLISVILEYLSNKNRIY